jgi:tRNA(Ile)-lysidine synthase
VTDVLPRVREGGLLQADRPVVVLYSGGRDSTCLLDVSVRIAGADQVTALHVNYGLRDAAGDDERHCRALCDRLGVRLEVRRPQRQEGNLQAWARDQRYAAAAAIARQAGADVAAGHTATDQVETILYRLASSPSRRALLGMRPRDGQLIRPLLEFTRAETAAHCQARGLTWREDDSNASGAFARNRIRRDLVPALEAAHPAAQANVLAVAEILRQEGAVLDELVDSALGGRGEIRLDELRELPGALQRLVVQRLADDAAGEPAAGVGRRADEVAALSDTGTASLDLPHGVRAIATGGVLRFGRTPPVHARMPSARGPAPPLPS